ncbi:MAG: hypothetical protein WCI94_23395 [Rhodospirillales bacterium]
MRPVVVPVALALIVAGTAARADILYSNGSPLQGNGTLISGATRAVADSFTLSTQANILTFEYSNWIVDTAGASASYTPGTVDWRITDTGIGGTTLASGNAALLSVVAGTTVTFNTGIITESLTRFSAGNVWLPAGTYWLELLNATVPGAPGTVSDRWGGATPATLTSQVYNGAAVITAQPSHFLEVTGVPEPFGLALFASGLAGIALARVRARRA